MNRALKAFNSIIWWLSNALSRKTTQQMLKKRKVQIFMTFQRMYLHLNYMIVAQKKIKTKVYFTGLHLDEYTIFKFTSYALNFLKMKI